MILNLLKWILRFQWVLQFVRWLQQRQEPTPPQPIPTPLPVPPPLPDPSPLPQTGADEIIQLVNKERAAQGIGPLLKDFKITEVAEKYALLMAQKNRLSHTLDGDIGWRLNDAKYYWRTAGENIGWNYNSPEEMVMGWMQSSGHRANILNPKYTRTGVGIKDTGNGPYYCQDFAG